VVLRLGIGVQLFDPAEERVRIRHPSEHSGQEVMIRDAFGRAFLNARQLVVPDVPDLK
jgi:hypothetical protein